MANRKSKYGILLCVLAIVLSPESRAWQASAHERALEEAGRGVALSRQGQYRPAVQAYRRALALDPNLPSLYLNLGLAYFKSGDFRDAAGAFQKADARAPSDRTKTLLAMSRFGLGQYSEAAALLEPLAAAQPENGEISYLLAKCYLWSKQTDRAMALFRSLLARDPDSTVVHMLMGEALDAERRTPEAITEFQAALKSNPAQPELHFGLGYLYWEEHQYEHAEREFREELKSNPTHARALAYLGDALLKQDRQNEAATVLKKAVALDNGLHLAHFDLALISEDRGAYDDAIVHFRQAIKADPEAFDAHYRLARLYQRLNRATEAQKELAVVKKLHQQKAEKPLIEVSSPQ